MNVSRWTSLFFLISILAPTAFGQTFTEMVILGDSGTDTGNAHSKLGIPTSPPYFEGRFSNGPVWAERLADRMGLPVPLASELGGVNYAWGGATTGTVRAAVAVPDMNDQLSAYLETHTPTADQLFVLWGGSNDLNLGQLDGTLPATFVVNQLTGLAEQGARNFLVLNLNTNKRSPSVVDRFIDFNQSLPTKLESVRLDDNELSITEFDVDKLFAVIESNSTAFGLADVQLSACRDCSYGENPNPTRIRDNPNTYFFWDLVHTTTKVHEILGDAVFNRLVMANGDLNQNGALDAGDIDALSSALQSGTNDVSVEMDGNWILDISDRAFWVHNLASTYFGDANLDGEFNSSDLITVLGAGEYEDSIELNSSWATGDWNADGEFDTSDLVVALADGGYEVGPRVAEVPEPSCCVLLVISVICLTRCRSGLTKHQTSRAI